MITISYIHRFLTSLGFTVIVETAILFILLMLVLKRRDIPPLRIALAGFFASFATIPYVWFVFPYAHTWSRETSLLWSEPFAFVVEAVFYRLFLKLDWRIAFAASFVANLASYLLGPLLRSYGLWIYW
ncbi:hypothetical protein A3C18_03590 [Candidatus Kaiserbacteria bacterium RIFCSPHIGHO2_02_FULL_54_11b]|uniref:Uncharacterized protein n=2 Tax=Candidatus Kaiseribacteriota TaxID=1752734 RepID=A0A1F6CIQ4_9BACT|nr:MAG: hypothetical protein A2704_03840 [Candidatus Kaiserbacteria bacterium RIFCSPHIGHO2_01_FULL_54_36b]OGG64226.1 MAG: hypothetical protein A3C18_03590 [Candidatus Kaiserbacteria bacterium RIFCSPHIGHO2_02_FULL_54_11b]